MLHSIVKKLNNLNISINKQLKKLFLENLGRIVFIKIINFVFICPLGSVYNVVMRSLKHHQDVVNFIKNSKIYSYIHFIRNQVFL